MAQPMAHRLAGRYEVRSLIGRGGMAEVHLGFDTRLSRVVAIKMLRRDLALDSIFQARFRREAQSAASLNHPNIVAVYDTGEEIIEDAPAVRSRCPTSSWSTSRGHTVKDLISDGTAVPINEAIEIVSGVRVRPPVLAREPPGASRHQAGQYHVDVGRQGQGHGLRYREGPDRLAGHHDADERRRRHRPSTSPPSRPAVRPSTSAPTCTRPASSSSSCSRAARPSRATPPSLSHTSTSSRSRPLPRRSCPTFPDSLDRVVAEGPSEEPRGPLPKRRGNARGPAAWWPVASTWALRPP